MAASFSRTTGARPRQRRRCFHDVAARRQRLGGRTSCGSTAASTSCCGSRAGVAALPAGGFPRGHERHDLGAAGRRLRRHRRMARHRLAESDGDVHGRDGMGNAGALAVRPADQLLLLVSEQVRHRYLLHRWRLRFELRRAASTTVASAATGGGGPRLRHTATAIAWVRRHGRGVRRGLVNKIAEPDDHLLAHKGRYACETTGTTGLPPQTGVHERRRRCTTHVAPKAALRKSKRAAWNRLASVSNHVTITSAPSPPSLCCPARGGTTRRAWRPPGLELGHAHLGGLERRERARVCGGERLREIAHRIAAGARLGAQRLPRPSTSPSSAASSAAAASVRPSRGAGVGVGAARARRRRRPIGLFRRQATDAASRSPPPPPALPPPPRRRAARSRCAAAACSRARGASRERRGEALRARRRAAVAPVRRSARTSSVGGGGADGAGGGGAGATARRRGGGAPPRRRGAPRRAQRRVQLLLGDERRRFGWRVGARHRLAKWVERARVGGAAAGGGEEPPRTAAAPHGLCYSLLSSSDNFALDASLSSRRAFVASSCDWGVEVGEGDGAAWRSSWPAWEEQKSMAPHLG